MTSGQILVVSDDTEFVRALSACWRKENHSLSMTAVSSRVGGQADSSGYLLVVVGPLREGVAFSVVAGSASRFNRMRRG